MPNRDLHRPAGAVLGFGTSLGLALHADSAHPVLESVAGALGGWIGGALPDWIDPADSPNHRGFGHGIFTAGTGVVFSVIKLRMWQEWLRGHARVAQARAGTEGGLWATKAAGCHILAGFIAGLIVGYASHLAADSLTSNSLPLC